MKQREIMSNSLRWLAALAVVVSGSALAADFDGSKKLICAPVQAMDCGEGVECVSGTPQSLGAPTFIRIDFDRKEVAGTRVTTPIREVEKSADEVLLQGIESGLGWTIAIDSASGNMHATMAGQDGAIILSGSCTPL
jgi:hypothetical protein